MEVFSLKKEINIQIGHRVHEARTQAHLSRDELAEKLNISSLFLSYIESGQKGMSLTTLSNLCNILKVSSDYILLGIDNNNTVSRKNLELMIHGLDERYLPLIEKQIKTLIHSLEDLEKKDDESL